MRKEIEVNPDSIDELKTLSDFDIISLYGQALIQGTLFPDSQTEWNKRESILHYEILKRMGGK